jgi:hypothetical protein
MQCSFFVKKSSVELPFSSFGDHLINILRKEFIHVLSFLPYNFFLVPQHDIAEKLLKLAFNTNESVNLPYSVKFYLDVMPFVSFVTLFSNCELGIWLNMSPT